MRPCQGRDDGATPFTRSSFRGRSSSAERSFDMREVERAALFAPTIFRGHSSASQSGCFTCIRSKARFLLPSPFLSLWCSPANTPASQAGEHRSEAGQGRHVQALKALSAMHSLGKRISPVQFRVRDPFLAVREDRSRASAQVGFISPLCPGRHRRLRPLSPPCSSLRISFVKNSCRSITGWRLHSLCSRSPMQRHDVESVASAGASPAASTIMACKH